MQFSKTSFTHNGVTTIYYSKGEGDPFIFLPGWGCTTKTYLPFLNIISEIYTVHMLELPGFGNGQNPGEVWSFTKYAEYVSAFIDSIAKKNIILSGHSFGGGVALYTAIQNRNIKKLVFFDATGTPINYKIPILFFYFAKELLIELINPKNIQTSMRVIKEFLLTYRNITYRIKLALAVFSGKQATSGFDIETIQTPVQIFWGNKDSVFTRKIAEELNTKLKGEKVIYVNGSHNWVIFQPELLRPYLNLI